MVRSSASSPAVEMSPVCVCVCVCVCAKMCIYMVHKMYHMYMCMHLCMYIHMIYTYTAIRSLLEAIRSD